MASSLSAVCNRLREYIKEDEVYTSYLNGELNSKHLSDFEKYCIQHCEDIKRVLDELSNNKKEINYLRGKLNK